MKGVPLSFLYEWQDLRLRAGLLAARPTPWDDASWFGRWHFLAVLVSAGETTYPKKSMAHQKRIPPHRITYGKQTRFRGWALRAGRVHL